MSRREHPTLEEWLGTRLDEVTPKTPQTAHFDELSPYAAGMCSRGGVPTMTEFRTLLELVVEWMGPSVETVKPVLALWLPESEALDSSIRPCHEYRCYRWEKARHANEEYDRCLHLEYFPAEG